MASRPSLSLQVVPGFVSRRRGNGGGPALAEPHALEISWIQFAPRRLPSSSLERDLTVSPRIGHLLDAAAHPHQLRHEQPWTAIRGIAWRLSNTPPHNGYDDTLSSILATRRPPGNTTFLEYMAGFFGKGGIFPLLPLKQRSVSRFGRIEARVTRQNPELESNHSCAENRNGGTLANRQAMNPTSPATLWCSRVSFRGTRRVAYLEFCYRRALGAFAQGPLVWDIGRQQCSVHGTVTLHPAGGM
ncbi:hypothetical protein QBC39DRAFT_111506 [Podospora conica]|nr:hypothetical protein QBC39DRAFT_111506 [Schizothecium conicum]